MAKKVSFLQISLLLIAGIAIGFAAAILMLSEKNTEGKAKPTDKASPLHSDLHQIINKIEDELQKNPQNSEIRLQLANLLFDMGRYNLAATHYEHLIKAESPNADMISDLGTCYRRMGNPRKALEYFQKAVDVNGSHTKAWYNIAVTSYFDLNDTSLARSALEKVIALDPFFPNAVELKSQIEKEESRQR